MLILSPIFVVGSGEIFFHLVAPPFAGWDFISSIVKAGFGQLIHMDPFFFVFESEELYKTNFQFGKK